MDRTPAPRVSRLPNGLRIASDPMPATGWVSLAVYVACSPLDETPRHGGAAHAIEHILLGRGPGDPAERLRAVDRAGALNAATAHDHTVYEADVLPERLDGVMELLGDALCRPVWDEWHIEQRVLAEEAALARDDPADRADGLARRALFGPAHPYGRPIEGTPASLEATTARTLAGLHARTYVGARMVVAAAGDVAHDELVAAARRHLGGLPTGHPAPPPGAPRPAPPRGGRDEGERTHLVVAAPAPGIGHPSWDAIAHVDALLAGMWSGRLTMELRERRGLTYDVWSGASPLRGHGAAMLGLAAAPAALEEAARLVGRELRTLRTGRSEAADLDTARTWVVDQTRLGFLHPATRAARAGRRLLAGLDVDAAAEDVRRLAAVTPADVADAARRIWRPSRMVAVTVGAPPSGLVGRLGRLLAG